MAIGRPNREKDAFDENVSSNENSLPDVAGSPRPSAREIDRSDDAISSMSVNETISGRKDFVIERNDDLPDPALTGNGDDDLPTVNAPVGVDSQRYADVSDELPDILPDVHSNNNGNTIAASGSHALDLETDDLPDDPSVFENGKNNNSSENSNISDEVSDSEQKPRRKRTNSDNSSRVSSLQKEVSGRKSRSNSQSKSSSGSKSSGSSKSGFLGFGKSLKNSTRKAEKKAGATAASAKKEDKIFGEYDKSQKSYVDKDNKKLLSFGSSGNKKKKKEDDLIYKFDTRENEQNAKLIQRVILGMMVFITVLGLWNFVNPKKGVSPVQAQQIAENVANNYGYPLDRAEGLTTNFMKAYLTSDPNDNVSQKALGYFYTGSMSNNADSVNRNFANNSYQKILYGPTVFDAKAISSNSGAITVGALVQVSTKANAAPSDGSTAKWEFFNVNVYYNSTSDQMFITKDSPSIIPNLGMGDVASLPDEAQVGNGSTDDGLKNSVQSTVYGFVQGYSTSSPSNHSSIDQYVIQNAPTALLTGLNGSFALAGTPDQAITYTPYYTSDPSIVKVDTQVIWKDTSASGSDVEYTSDYIIAMQKQADGKWLVGKFAPKYYVKGNS